MSDDKKKKRIVKVKRTPLNSEFLDILQDKKIFLKFYKALYSEDVDVTEDTLELVIIDDDSRENLYDDYYAVIGDNKVPLRIELQSYSLINETIGIFSYLAKNYHK